MSINQNTNNTSKNETMENSKKRELYDNTDWKKSAIIDTNKKDSININHFYNQNEKQFYGCIHKNMIIGENHGLQHNYLKVMFRENGSEIKCSLFK